MSTEFGKRLREARIKKNITQKQLAEMLDHKDYKYRVSVWESKNFQLTAIRDYLKVCLILEQDPFSFFFGENVPKFS